MSCYDLKCSMAHQMRNCLMQMRRKWFVLFLLCTLFLFNLGMIEVRIFRNMFPGYFSQTVLVQPFNCDNRRPEQKDDSLLSENEMLKYVNIEVRGSYTVINNYIKSLYQSSHNSSVALCTQGTYEFLHHVKILCERWQAPLSVTVYAPGSDFYSAIRHIVYLRQCGPKCIINNVTWHLIYDNTHPPPDGVPTVLDYGADCTKEPTTLTSYRKAKSLIYPINVARNVARLNANTYYVFVSDIELYPSLNIVPRFLEMVSKEKVSSTHHVYMLPPFEMKEGLPVPFIKSELVKMVKKHDAVFFHKQACDTCHSFPQRDKWLETIPSEKSMGVFHITKGRKDWEPFYIGTAKEPLFDERFTWEGKNNKISHTQLLCFMDYDIYILDNAFLMHTPGIKTPKIVSEDQKRRSKHLSHNKILYDKLRKDLQKKYPNRTHC